MRKRIFSLILTCLLLVTTAMPVSAAKNAKEEKEPVVIETVEQFLAFAEACRLDAYSRDLEVSLETDLDLSDMEFAGIPIFCGTFNGKGHTITGLNLTVDGSNQGLFRYLTAEAVVQNLLIEGTLEPAGSRGNIGAVAGHNSGTVMNCTFTGSVIGTDGVGGIVGYNGVSGIIENCKVQGVVSGNHFVGGIAGENNGVLRNCVNQARVNATASENSVSLSDMTVETLTNSESSATATDIGGIAGSSNGVIRSCSNEGVIGYRNMGYNIGGIAGSQSGYLVDCKNNGDVYGRKEVGGIVGHMEPFSVIEYSQDALQILEGQLNSLSALTSQAGSKAIANANSISGEVDQLQDYTETAMDAVNVLRPGSGADADSIIAAQGALSNSINGMSGTMGNISSAASDTATSLSRDMQAISAQINAMSGTLKQATANVGGSFTDVSDEDTPKDTGGKVASCENDGAVYGDMNIGGIAGAMAMENDLDAGDDWSIFGSESMNVSGEIRAVVLNCTNKGIVTGNKKHVGGLVGWQYVGLVKESANVGAVDAEAADYVGGISGQSNGYIRNCDSKCALYGKTYVGGIAGAAGIVTECYSLVEIYGATERVGAVLGVAEGAETDGKDAPIRENYYLVTDIDFGAIDGISYAGQAESKVMEEFVAMETLSKPFRTVTLRFYYEKGEPVELVVPLGGSVSKDEIPEIPEKSGYVSQWEGLADADLNQVLYDMDFHAQYISQTSVIASEQLRENGVPLLLVQGLFTDEAKLKVTESENGPNVGFGKVLMETWNVRVSEAEHVTSVRYRLPDGSDGEHIKMYVCGTDKVWHTADFTVDGSYAVISFTADHTAIAYAQTAVWSNILAVAAIGVLLLAWQYRDKLPKKTK